jgi:hypothetical protein
MEKAPGREGNMLMCVSWVGVVLGAGGLK